MKIDGLADTVYTVYTVTAYTIYILFFFLINRTLFPYKQNPIYFTLPS